MFEQMLRVGAGDVVLGISLPRYSGRTVKVMQYAHDRQATVLAITDKPDAPAGSDDGGHERRERRDRNGGHSDNHPGRSNRTPRRRHQS